MRVNVCFKGISRVFQECFSDVSRMRVFQGCCGCSNGVSMVLCGCFKGVSRVLPGCFKVVSRVLWVFQGCFNGVVWVFQGGLNGFSREFEGVSKVLQDYCNLLLLLYVS